MAEAAPCFKDIWVRADTTSFVTLDGSMEVMLVEITNKTDEAMEIVPIGAIPIYGRSADNIRDHRHVTSLLHRIEPHNTALRLHLSSHLMSVDTGKMI